MRAFRYGRCVFIPNVEQNEGPRMRGESHGGLCCEEQRVESKLCPVVMYIVHQRCDRRSDRVKIIGMALQSQKKVVQLYRELVERYLVGTSKYSFSNKDFPSYRSVSGK